MPYSGQKPAISTKTGHKLTAMAGNNKPYKADNKERTDYQYIFSWDNPMSGRIEAALRFIKVADNELTAARSHVNGFIQVLETTTDAAAKRAQGVERLTGAREGARLAIASLESSKTSLGAAGDAGKVAVAAVDDARAGVDSLVTAFDQMLDTGGKGKVAVDPDTFKTTIEAARAKVATARTAVKGLPADGTLDLSELDKVGKELVEAKSLPETITQTHVDDVVAKAKALNDSSITMPTVTKVSDDMIAMAQVGKYDTLVGREEEINKVINILKRQKKSNPILLGDPGVGKTQLVEGLANRIAKGEVPEQLKDMKIFSINVADLKAEAGAEQGAMEKLIKALLTEVKTERAKGKQVVLFIDEMHTLMNAGDASQQLKPALARGEISLIGATTFEEFSKFIKEDAALTRRVAQVNVEELDEKQVGKVLETIGPVLSAHHDTIVMDSALKEAQKLSSRYSGRKQPDAAIELLDHTLSRTGNSWKGAAPVRYLELENEVKFLTDNLPHYEEQTVLGDVRAAAQLTSANERLAVISPQLDELTAQLEAERTILTERSTLAREYLAARNAGDTKSAAKLATKMEAVNAKVADLRTTYPERLLTDITDVNAVRAGAEDLYGVTVSADGADEALRTLKLPEELASRVIGQRQATDKIAEAMIGIKSGMKDPDAPAGVFLFLGPTGVGKTEAVRVTADVMTGDTKNMIRINMGEFSEPHSIAKLFGSPPGYVGYQDAPRLAEIIKRPDAHVLFDEVEKGHHSIFQKILALVEEGQATLGDGTVVDARDTTFYMTSNLQTTMKDPRKGLVRDFFSPEFLNRLNAVVEFNSLTEPDVTKIFADLHLPKVLKRALSNGLDIDVLPAARDRIAALGFDPEFGARPLKRSVTNHITTPTSKMILELKSRGVQVDEAVPHKVTLDVSGDGLVMKSNSEDISIPIAAVRGTDHIPGSQPSAPGALPSAVTNGKQPLEWNLGDNAEGAVQPPKPQPEPVRP